MGGWVINNAFLSQRYCSEITKCLKWKLGTQVLFDTRMVPVYFMFFCSYRLFRYKVI